MTDWLAPALDPHLRKEAVARAIEALSKHDFDTIVVCGVSGLLLGPIVAHLMDKKLVVIRKDGETSHSWRLVEGCWGDKYVIIDDFIASGVTVKYMQGRMVDRGQCVGYYGYHVNDYESQKAKCAGLAIEYLCPAQLNDLQNGA